MKYSKIFRILALAITLSLLVIAIPATPVLAAAITLSPTSGPPGTQITVTGTAFSTGHDIEITFDDASRGSLILAGTTFTYSITVPAGKPAGSYLVKVIDWSLTNPTVVASATFTVTDGTTVTEGDIDLYPRRGPVGTEVEIDGADFGDREDIIVEYDGDEIDIEDGDRDTDSDGDFTCYIIIPESAAGDHTITVIGEDTDIEAEAEFTVQPEITISPEKGTPKSNVTVTGTGFGRRAQVFVYFADYEITMDEADTNGSFRTTFTALDMTSGTYDIEVEDEDGNTATAEFTIEIESRADINTAEGNVGTQITLSGIGFKASGKITIKYDDTDIATVTADSNGTFSASFDAPASIGGTHTITATDGTITKEFTFTMESTPPLIPPPLQPATGTVIEEKEDAYFDWDDVTDDSLPVTFNLQIATDRNFTDKSVVLEKRNLEDSEYALSAGEWESLVPTEETEDKEITYYWRVKATDSASNKSDWSSLGSFAIPSPGLELDLGGLGLGMPPWVKYALFGIGAIIIGLIGFWLGRRTAFH